MSNPYINGSVIRKDEQFYGRKQLIEELTIPESRAYYIKGNRRTGKTSLLRQIERHLLTSQSILPIYLDLEGAINNYDRLRYLQRAINNTTRNLNITPISEFSAKDLPDAIGEVIQFASLLNRHCFLLLDEAEQLLQLTESELAKLHRELVNTHENLTVIMTATNQLQELANQKINHVFFLENFIVEHLGCLTLIDAEKVVRQSNLEKADQPFLYQPLLEKILYNSGCHPYLLQRLCYQLFDKDRGYLRDIKRKDLMLDQQLDNFFQLDFNHLNKEQQNILLQFTWELPLNLSEVKTSKKSDLLELENLGFLVWHDNKFFLRNYFLAQWLDNYRKKIPLDADKTLTPKKIFISYSHEDILWKDKLRKQLKILERKYKIIIWEDTHLLPGQQWNKEIEEQLESADIFLFLVSPDLLASDFIMETEFTKALDKSKKNKATIVPVIMRDCAWQESNFSQFQVLPKDGKPVSSYSNDDEPLSEVVKRINAIL